MPYGDWSMNSKLVLFKDSLSWWIKAFSEAGTRQARVLGSKCDYFSNSCWCFGGLRICREYLRVWDGIFSVGANCFRYAFMHVDISWEIGKSGRSILRWRNKIGDDSSCLCWHFLTKGVRIGRMLAVFGINNDPCGSGSCMMCRRHGGEHVQKCCALSHYYQIRDGVIISLWAEAPRTVECCHACYLGFWTTLLCLLSVSPNIESQHYTIHTTAPSRVYLYLRSQATKQQQQYVACSNTMWRKCDDTRS